MHVLSAAGQASADGESKQSQPQFVLGSVVRIKDPKSADHGDVAVVTNVMEFEVHVFLHARTKKFHPDDLEILGHLAQASPKTLSAKDQVGFAH